MDKAMEQEIKSLIEALAKEEFGNNYDGLEFDGPYEDEDFGADILLKQEMGNSEVSGRVGRIMWEVRRRGWDVPMSWEVSRQSS